VNNRLLRRIRRNESGQALVMVLIVLLLGSLIIPPTLNLMQTGLITEKTVEVRTGEYYGADAGVERVLIWLKDNQGDPTIYPKDNQVMGFSPPLVINGNQVCATLQYAYADSKMNSVYQIHSLAGPGITAFTDMDGDDDRDTTDLALWLASAGQPYTLVVAYVTDATGNFEGLAQHAITTQGDEIEGLKQSDVIPPSGEHGPVTGFTGPWPTATQLSRFYWEDVKNSTPMPYPQATYYVTPSSSLGPIYRNGTFAISCSMNGTPTLTLNDTLYITGNTEIGMTNKDFTLNLNGHTIYVESDTAGNQYALKFGGKCTLKGPGCIIAVGNIDFQPKLEASQDYILVLSVTGKTLMHPKGNFYGTLAGSTLVDLQPGCTATWVEPPANTLNFPGFEQGRFWIVSSWQIHYG
jgi:hypothetical protein